MSFSIIYSSKTGNTMMLADTIWKILRQSDCIYCGIPDQTALSADRLYIGFWTDKGSCDSETASFLEKVHGKEVFLFGTAGFGGEPAYFKKILNNVCKHLDDSNSIIGTYMCQGKMPMAVRERYVKMLEAPDHMANIEGLIANFDRALSHPDEADLEQLKECLQNTKNN